MGYFVYELRDISKRSKVDWLLGKKLGKNRLYQGDLVSNNARDIEEAIKFLEERDDIRLIRDWDNKLTIVSEYQTVLRPGGSEDDIKIDVLSDFSIVVSPRGFTKLVDKVQKMAEGNGTYWGPLYEWNPDPRIPTATKQYLPASVIDALTRKGFLTPYAEQARTWRELQENERFQREMDITGAFLKAPQLLSTPPLSELTDRRILTDEF